MSTVRATRYAGSRVHRVEDARLLTGAGTFVDDISRPGMLHACFVRSPHPRARIVSVDRAAALALPGVHAVFTAADLNPGVREAWYSVTGQAVPDTPRPPLAEGEARFAGDPVALVIADSRYIAEDAAELVDVDYEPLTAVPDYATAAGSPERVHEGYPGNLAGELGGAPGETVAAVFDAAPHVVTETIWQQAYAAVPMETRGLVAEWSGGSGELTIWAATQAPHEVRMFAARLLGVPEHQVRVITRDVGGGFGQKVVPLLGVGISCYAEPTSAGFGFFATEGATIRIEPSGKVNVYVAGGSTGNSLETTVVQLTADALGADIGDVHTIQGDTAVTPFGAGTGGSRSGSMTAGAVGVTAAGLRAKLITMAAHKLEAAEADIDLANSRAGVRGDPDAGVSFAELADIAYFQPFALPPGMAPGLEASGRYTPSAPILWACATHVCTCEVDVVTGAVRLLRYVVGEDCGHMINPAVVEGQIAGGVVQGIGGALLEELAVDGDGNPVATTFMDYLLPTAADVPVIEYAHVETAPGPGPGGYKGVGEGGAIGAPPAVVNAVADALSPFGVPLLTRATPLIGHFQIRNRGTIGGSLAHADAAAEYPAVALALDATITALSPRGERTIPAGQFFTGIWSTALKPDEVLTGVTFPAAGRREGFAIEEFARRPGDFAVAGAAVAVELDGDGAAISRCRIGLFGLGPTPLRAVPAETAAVGAPAPSPLTAAQIGRAAVADLASVPSDRQGGAAYRKRVGAAVVAAAVSRAIEEAAHG